MLKQRRLTSSCLDRLCDLCHRRTQHLPFVLAPRRRAGEALQQAALRDRALLLAEEVPGLLGKRVVTVPGVCRLEREPAEQDERERALVLGGGGLCEREEAEQEEGWLGKEEGG